MTREASRWLGDTLRTSLSVEPALARARNGAAQGGHAGSLGPTHGPAQRAGDVRRGAACHRVTRLSVPQKTSQRTGSRARTTTSGAPRFERGLTETRSQRMDRAAARQGPTREREPTARGLYLAQSTCTSPPQIWMCVWGKFCDPNFETPASSHHLLVFSRPARRPRCHARATRGHVAGRLRPPSAQSDAPSNARRRGDKEC